MSLADARPVTAGATARMARDLELPRDAPPTVAAILTRDAIDVARVFRDDDHGWLVELAADIETAEGSETHTIVVGLDAVEITPEPEWWASR